MKYVVETSLFGKLIDGFVSIDELPSDGLFVASHVQRDELSRTVDLKRRAALLEKFTEIIDESVRTESFNLGVSALGGAKLGEGLSYHSIKAELDLHRRKRNNAQDALIAETALENGYTLLTADGKLHEIAKAHGILSKYWETPCR